MFARVGAVFGSLALWQKVGLALLAIVLMQLWIPSGALPLRSQLDGRAIGWQTRSTLAKTLASNTKNLRLQLGDQTVTFAASEAGISADNEQAASDLPAVSMPEKLIPLWPVIKLAGAPHVTTRLQYDDKKLTTFAAGLAEKYSTDPQDATAAIKEGKLVISKESNGKTFTQATVSTAIKNLRPYAQASRALEAELIKPKVTAKHFDSAKNAYDTVQNKTLSVTYGDTTKTYSASEFNKWLEIQGDVKNTTYILQFNLPRLQEAQVAWAKDYNIAAGVTQVRMVDDVEVSRVTGSSGRMLDVEQIQKQFNEWLAKPDAAPIKLANKTVSPRVAVTRTYTNASARLQAQLNAWVASHSGSYQIAIQELNGRGRAASYNVSQQTVMASTYKLFLAYAAYHQAEIGALNLNASLTGGKTIAQCMEVMIVNSDNPCAVALGKKIGWAKVDQIIAAAGFKNVKLNNYDSSGNMVGDKLVNANELARFLSQLSAGSLMNNSHTSLPCLAI